MNASASIAPSRIKLPVQQAPRCLIDFEARSECDLKACGATVYAEHPSTQILCMSYSFADEVVKLWTPWVEGYEEYQVEKTSGRGKNKTTVIETVREACMVYRPDLCPFPQEVIDHVLSDGTIEAHSVGMERSIWRAIITKQFGAPPCTRWVDTQATCAYRGIPLALGEAGTAMDVDILKDTAGKDILRKICKPRKPTKKDQRTWNNSPALFDACFKYCIRDNEAERALGKKIGELPDTEYRVWVLDQVINSRGVKIDVEAVHATQKLAEKVTENLNAELRELTEGEIDTGGQHAEIAKWLEAKHKIIMPDMTASRIKDTLKDKGIPIFVKGSPETYPRRVLEIRREISRTSTKKLASMLNCLSADGRIHGLLQYHGAQTGRWAGRLTQPQNFPRPKVNGKPFKGDMEALISILLWSEPELIAALYGPEMEAIAASLRGMFVAADGCKYVVVDFASIEARIVLWLAGQMDAMDIFKKADAKLGPDIYCYLATDLYGRPITKADEMERQLGKIGVLGCFEADTLVLTKRGVIPIVKVSTDDWLWDGVEWVQSDGWADQGVKQTIRLAGVGVTPDHQIFSGERKYPAAVAARDGRVLSRALDNAMVSLPLSVIAMGLAGELPLWSRNARVGADLTEPLSPICTTGERPGATHAPRSKAAIGKRPIAATLTLFLTTACAAFFSTVSRPALTDAIIPTTATSSTTADAASSSTALGGRIAANTSAIWSRLTAGITPIWRLIGRTSIKDTGPAISASPPVLRTSPTADRSPSCSNASSNLKRVYDVVNAGPRRRFTIITSLGPLIVSNCGYQMSAPRLQEQAHDDYELDLPLATCEKIVTAYRTKFSDVPVFWREINNTACYAVEHEQVSEHRGIVYEVVRDNAGKWLSCRLPNGKRIWYYNPYVTHEPAPPAVVKKYPKMAGKMFPKLWYEGRDNKRGGIWTTISSYGGMLTENIVQAIAREIMKEAMIRAEQAGYVLVLTVHDELVTEVPKDFGSYKELERIAAQDVPWCPDLPVAAEGWQGPRYRKA